MERNEREFIMPLEQFGIYFSNKGYSKNTIKNYIATVRMLLIHSEKTENEYREINQSEIDNFIFYLRNIRKVSDNSIRTYLFALMAFQKFFSLKFSIELNKIEKKIPEVLTLLEIGKLLETKNERDYIIMRLFISTGLRVSELIELRTENIGREMKIKGKGKKERIVFMDAETDKIINDYVKKNKIRGYIFQNHGEKLSIRTIQLTVRKNAKRACISKRVTPHTLRHSFATIMLQNGSDLITIKEILGHETVATTQIYTHVSDEIKRQVYEETHPFSDSGNIPF